jgi:acyl-CoA thioesterase-1
MLKKLLLLFLIGFTAFTHAEDKTILIYGDSLSAGYGISLEDGWVSLLQQKLKYQGYRYRVVNASISGDTSRGARSRVTNILGELNPSITIIELGGNDGLRGIMPDEMKQNLASIITQFEQAGSQILLVPMMIPPNLGPAYSEKFMAVYRTLAEEHDIYYGKFILEGVALNPELMQRDGIHANAAGQPAMLDNIWPDLENIMDNMDPKPGKL